MKIALKTRTDGSVIILALITAAVIGISLASYLSLISTQSTSVARSMNWNSAIPVLESGIEEALTQLHYTAVTNLSANSWSLGADGYYHKTRTVGTYGSYFDVSIRPTDPPTITSIGYVPTPLSSTANPTYVKRTVQVKTQLRGMYVNALTVKGTVSLGQNFLVDSFDSTDPLYSTNGQYTASKRKTGGDIASIGGFVNEVQVDSSQIFGKVKTAPGGSMSIGNKGMVGDIAFQSNSSNQGKVQSGWYSDDLSMDLPNVEMPTMTFFSPVGGRVGGTNYDYILTSGNWIANGMFKGNILVTGNAVLYVPPDATLHMSGSDGIIIAPGASLKIYNASTGNCIICGVENGGGDATKFAYYGLPSSAGGILSLNANSRFVGTIYSPNQDVRLSSSNTSDLDFVGSVVANSATASGHFLMHFDENLKKSGGSSYVVLSWNEI
ncbi:MAG: hypothetical protein JWN25_2304 [Verrucomicrobiales bacterium]|nr:hypothetical protein [Verrucomicrobiales bacterium]MDB6129273.1 hypothetical protein [Verrucomicrobiales bacterium]